MAGDILKAQEILYIPPRPHTPDHKGYELCNTDVWADGTQWRQCAVAGYVLNVTRKELRLIF
jgi:hypothetical protein